MNALHRDPALIAEVGTVLSGMRELSASLLAVAVVTDDGFLVGEETAQVGGRFASMTSSVQALGDAVMREIGRGASDYILIAAPTGHLLQQRIPGTSWVLAASFDSAETIGKALSVAKRAAEQLGAVLTARGVTVVA